MEMGHSDANNISLDKRTVVTAEELYSREFGFPAAGWSMGLHTQHDPV